LLHLRQVKTRVRLLLACIGKCRSRRGFQPSLPYTLL
jgi:hypothetical protein